MTERSRFCILFLLLLLCTACDASGSSLPPNVQMGAEAITARQTSDAASARSNALAAQATAVKQATQFAADVRSTDAAIQLGFLKVTAEALASQEQRVNLAKTETARDTAARRGTDTAIQFAFLNVTATAEARQSAEAKVRKTETARQAAATNTRLAEQPTQTRAAEIANEARANRERAVALDTERARWEFKVAPVVSAAWLFLPLCFLCAIVALLLYGIWRIVLAMEAYIHSRALENSSRALPSFLVKNAAGDPIGYMQIENNNRSIIFTPIEPIPLDEPADLSQLPPAAPILTHDYKDAPKAIAPPAEPLVGDFIYPSTLRAFTQAILAENDWTQARWRDKVLPRGYVLSMDTRDSRGNIVYGGYSRLIQLYEDRHLIINRRAGTMGQWNPNAPRDIERVMDILEKKAPLPPIQVVEPPAVTASPTPPRKRAKKSVPQLS